jgi:hypothetical protein
MWHIITSLEELTPLDLVVGEDKNLYCNVHSFYLFSHMASYATRNLNTVLSQVKKLLVDRQNFQKNWDERVLF